MISYRLRMAGKERLHTLIRRNLLGFALDRLVDRSSTICTWDSSPKMEALRNTFARQAIPMTWDFAEGNPFSASSGNWSNNIEWISMVIDNLPSWGHGYVRQLDAAAINNGELQPIISTDPPYYGNVGYSELSDFFYVWLRRSLNMVFPDIFSTVLVPKAQELVATPFRFEGNREKARAFFENGMRTVFAGIKSCRHPGYPTTVYYAFKQVDLDDEEDSSNGILGPTSTGWETMLEALNGEGFAITGTWPMRTELGNRPVASGTNALASSIVIVCRPRHNSASLATRRDFLRTLKRELPEALKIFTSGRVAPVDLQQAAIGPGMAIFSSYAKVLKPDGRPMSVRTALGAINEVIQTYFAEQESELDPATQFCLTWYKQYGTKPGRYGEADILSKAKDISIARLERDGVLKQGGGWVQIYPAYSDAYQEIWDPRNERSFTIWSATHHLVAAHRHGNPAAAEIAAALGGYAEQARTLAYELYEIASAPGHGWAEEAWATTASSRTGRQSSSWRRRRGRDGELGLGMSSITGGAISSQGAEDSAGLQQGGRRSTVCGLDRGAPCWLRDQRRPDRPRPGDASPRPVHPYSVHPGLAGRHHGKTQDLLQRIPRSWKPGLPGLAARWTSADPAIHCPATHARHRRQENRLPPRVHRTATTPSCC